MSGCHFTVVISVHTCLCRSMCMAMLCMNMFISVCRPTERSRTGKEVSNKERYRECIHVSTYIHTHIYIYMYVYLYIQYTCTYTWTYHIHTDVIAYCTYTHIHMQLQSSTSTCTYIVTRIERERARGSIHTSCSSSPVLGGRALLEFLCSRAP